METPKEWSRRGYARRESVGDGDEHGCTGAARAWSRRRRRGAGEARARRSYARAAAQGRSEWSSGGEWARGGGARVRAAVREEEGSEHETDSRGPRNG